MTLDGRQSGGTDPRSLRPVSGDTETVREFLGFVVGDELYALPLASIRQILRPPRITPVPRAPRDVVGIIPVRGTVTTLIDLRRRLHMAERPIGPRARVLLVDQGDEVMGALVDEVLHVVRLTADQMELATVLGNETGAHVMGIGRPGFSMRRSDGVLDGEAGGRVDHEILVLLEPGSLLRSRHHES